MCLYPKLIRNKKYQPNQKNGGNPPPLKDMRTLWVPIGCQDCIECRRKKARDWSVRLQEEIRTNKNGKFVTLTFSTEAITKLYKECKAENELAQWDAIINDKEEIPETLTGYKLDNAAATLAIRRFLERWRKKYKKSVKHWLITEIGGRNWQHIHIHGIIWTDEKIEPIWQYGGVFLGRYREERAYGKHYVNEKTITYITKYFHKIDIKHKAFKSKIHASAGIGGNYINSYNFTLHRYKPNETHEVYVNPQGYKLGLPIYYRNKAFTEEQREQLWIEKLNKNERWVMGQRIEFNGNKEEDGYKLLSILEEARKHSGRLGYGNNTAWKYKEYENEVRELFQNTRMQAALDESVTYHQVYNQIKKAPNN